MKYLIISDIHSNLEALASVLADAQKRQPDSVICLGDFVGYGANPNECVQTIADLPNATAVLGNHDAAVIDLTQREMFNPVARAGILYSAANLQEENIDYLKGLPLIIDSHDDFIAAHASPYKPEAWVYVVEPLEAADAFHVMSHPLAFIGHTHFPAVHSDNGAVVPFAPEGHIKVNEGQKIVINVGSVGQPRDGDPRAAYVIYDGETKTVTIFRVEYDVDQAAAKILDAGLPPMLADRLRRGY
jgi:diadenosine tetraphosphatase ApaH/serine/threonine PP2A family protein phosphatase